MKLKCIVTLAALTGVVAAGPGRPGFAGAPDWLDIDGNGQIDPEERQAFAELRRDAARSLNERADANNDGEVDEAERHNMIAAMRANVEAKRCALFEAAAGEDGLLSLDEFSAVHPVGNLPDRVVSRLFGLLDVSGGGENGDEPDGLVSKDEFLASLHAPEDPDPDPDPETPDTP